MKKIVLNCSALFVILLSVKAQTPPVITSANNYVVGDISIMHSAVATGINPGPSGANVVWDFSSLKSVTPPDSSLEQFVNAATTPFTKDFPDAEVAVAVGGSQNLSCYYYSFKNNSFANYGNEMAQNYDTLSLIFDKPQIYYSYPLTYGTSQKTSYNAHSAVQNSSFKDIEERANGTVNTVADGYGTLKIMGKTFSNVLRIHDMINEIDSLPKHDSSIFTEDIWYYLTPGKKDPIFEIFTYNNGTINTGVSYNIDNFVVESNFVNNIVLYPNPANEKCTLSFTSNSDVKANITIMNQLGQVTNSIQNQSIKRGNNIFDLNNAGLRNGLYFVIITTGGNNYMEKLVID